MALTAKQEAFAQAVATGKTQADAYRTAYNAGNMKPPTVQKRASELMSCGEVSGRVAELRKPVVAAAQITLSSHLERLKALSESAEASNQFSASIAAEVARGKASGLYVDKMEHTGKDGASIDMSIQLSFVKPA
jgi:hypothetical protein